MNNRLIKKSSLYFLFSLLLTLLSFGQLPVKYGVVSKKELSMTQYEPDPSANAVVLFDIGRLGRDFRFTRHVRIKILSQGGASWGNWTLNTPSKGMINATVFNLEGGLVKSSKLLRTEIFNEEVVSGFEQYKFFLPDVKAGSVIDLKYSFVGIPYEWRFQELIPVLYSELAIGKIHGLQFSKRSYGLIDFRTVGTNHWVMKNVPAFKTENNLNHYSNYISKIQFEINTISIPGLYLEHASTWENVSDLLQDRHTSMGSLMRNSGFLIDKAREIQAMEIDTLEKIHVAFDYIQDNINWDGTNSVMPSRRYASNFKKHLSVNSAEVNLLLVSLLQKIGVQAVPVVLSTRNNGLITSFFPTINKLNYVVGIAVVNSEFLVLDATGKNLRPGIAPERCLNGNGYALLEEGGFWVDLKQKNKVKRKSLTKISKNENGEWTAEIAIRRSSYDYLDWANELDKSESEGDFRKSIQKEHPGLIIEDYTISKKDPEKLSVSEKFTVTLEDHVDDLNHEIFIDPFIFKDINDNPFRSTERLYPVDLATPKDLSATIQIQIPEGFQLLDLPESTNISLPDNAASAKILYRQVGNTVQINSSIKINKVFYVQDEYEWIKSFYSVILDKMSESITLRKTT